MNFTTFRKDLSAFKSGHIVFVGLGNEYRGDDAVGLVFLDRLKDSKAFPDAHFIRAGTNPENYLQEILSYHPKLVVFIDAARWSGEPGEMRWLEPKQIRNLKISTHAYSLELVEEFLKAHEKMEFRYFGSQPLSTEVGEKLSAILKKKLEKFFLS